MNIILGKIEDKNLTPFVYNTLINNYLYQDNTDHNVEGYEDCHLCMDKESAENHMKGVPPENGYIVFISREVYDFIANGKTKIVPVELIVK